MDFFEAQERAKRRTNRLVVLFVVAVLGTIAASYLATSSFMIYAVSEETKRPLAQVWWDDRRATAVAAVVVLIVGIASLFKWSQLRAGGSIVAEMVGGRHVDPSTSNPHERRLLNVVEEMAIASGTPVPSVYILEGESGINAFAAGLTTADAVVTVTRGTMEKLTRDELQGVIAHEFSHILNGDMRLNVRLTALIFGILAIGLIGKRIISAMGRANSSRKGSPGLPFLFIGIALLIIGYFGYFFGRLIQAAVSRQREFLADASAVQFTRNPTGIAGALKKIGGYALGSRLLDNRSAEIGHFFFAQSFRSSFGGLWATHPPLPERIRAIEPTWDGELFEPPELVAVERESFASAGLAGSGSSNRHERPASASARAPIAFDPISIVAGIGALTETHFTQAQAKLAALPPGLRDAAHDTATAPALVFALLVSGATADLRERQLATIKQHSGEAAASATSHLLGDIAQLPADARLPLLQICLPTLRALDRAALDRFVGTLDELVHADASVSVFEFALQKMLVHQLDLLRRPRQTVEFHSFRAVVGDVNAVLSTLARLNAGEETAAQAAFAAGATQIPLIATQLRLANAADTTLERLDTALDRLALSSLPIKQRVLVAAAQVVSADRTVSVEEGELYRAIAAALDCPVPGLASAPAA